MISRDAQKKHFFFPCEKKIFFTPLVKKNNIVRFFTNKHDKDRNIFSLDTFIQLIGNGHHIMQLGLNHGIMINAKLTFNLFHLNQSDGLGENWIGLIKKFVVVTWQISNHQKKYVTIHSCEGSQGFLTVLF